MIPLALESYLPSLLAQIDDFSGTSTLPAYVADHVTQLVTYNATGGKLIRGRLIVSLANALLGDADFEDAVIEKAMALGWCVELVPACLGICVDAGILFSC